MQTDIGEYIVGAYLKSMQDCDFVDYNVRIPDGGLKGLAELDVIGLNLKTNTAYLCEVTTHIRGLLYRNNQYTVEKIKQKHQAQKDYAGALLQTFSNKVYMLWSPYVPVGYITEHLQQVDTLELVINEDYTACVEEMKRVAAANTNDLGNPFLRTLQILEHLR
ncbi:hypothetical protein SAMN05192534_13615 [Alteribacillus persepolensis]|uniref:PD-(D/E)XK nuclease superfamily protein n=1 Tax=Alteribacillus persepolensis TaxID=568899 RepID=A0A1G8JRG9_9BACI|nr:hypothetical protein [Alteribacillus persepolensis]SDI33879.1 hypothetical protein SAMN05192534_13615 [Alteribacillus persepolensis]